MRCTTAAFLCLGLVSLVPAIASAAVSSAEIYTTSNYHYGRYSAKIQFAGQSGVISSFFLWKEPSYKPEVFWNELDFEKVGLNSAGACSLELNAITGLPGPVNHISKPTTSADICSAFHVYTYEWTPSYIAWFMDGTEIRREVGDIAQMFKDNAPDGMQFRFNVWPGDASFGGKFDESSLPVYEVIDWVSYEKWNEASGSFDPDWKDEFDGTDLASRWGVGDWDSPKNLSKHTGNNVTVKDGHVWLALTSDKAGPPTLPTSGTTGSGVTGAAGGASTPTSGSAGANNSGSAGAATAGATAGSVAGAPGGSSHTAGGAGAGAGAGTLTGVPSAGAAGGGIIGAPGTSGAKAGTPGASSGTSAGAGNVAPPSSGVQAAESDGCAVTGRGGSNRAGQWLGVAGLLLVFRAFQRRARRQS